jgi:hypothetical protein
MKLSGGEVHLGVGLGEGGGTMDHTDHPSSQIASRRGEKNKMALCPAVPSHTVPSSAVPTTPSHPLLVARLASGAFHGASLLSQASVSVKVSLRTARVGSAHYGGVICTSVHGARQAMPHESPQPARSSLTSALVREARIPPASAAVLSGRQTRRLNAWLEL